MKRKNRQANMIDAGVNKKRKTFTYAKQRYTPNKFAYITVN